jgi:formiminotetrahydrofolate cyclodeaminase
MKQEGMDLTKDIENGIIFALEAKHPDDSEEQKADRTKRVREFLDYSTKMAEIMATFSKEDIDVIGKAMSVMTMNWLMKGFAAAMNCELITLQPIHKPMGDEPGDNSGN